MREARRFITIRSLLPLLVLLGLIALAQWLLRVNQEPPAQARISHDPDYTMENFVATAIGIQGKPKNRLQSRSMAHFPDNDTSEFTLPHITIFPEVKVPWEITSKRGWMSGNQEFILLRDAVLIENPTAVPRKRVTVVTRDLRVLADKEYAETDQPTIITSQGSVTYGTGMRAYIREGRLQLLSKVRGIYEPKPKVTQN